MDGIDTVSPKVYMGALDAVMKTLGKDHFESDEHFREVVMTWARAGQKEVNAEFMRNCRDNNN